MGEVPHVFPYGERCPWPPGSPASRDPSRAYYRVLGGGAFLCAIPLAAWFARIARSLSGEPS